MELQLFILSGGLVLLFGAMIAHYIERGNLLIELAVRDERITRLFAENKALENIAQELINAKSN